MNLPFFVVLSCSAPFFSLPNSVAAIKVQGGMTGVAYIYDEPDDDFGGTVNAVTRWDPTGYTSSEPAVEDDSHERRDSYTATNRKLITNHIWNPCCTDGFATQPMGKDFKVCTAFKKGRTGVDDGIFFYEKTGGNYNLMDALSRDTLVASRSLSASPFGADYTSFHGKRVHKTTPCL